MKLTLISIQRTLNEGTTVTVATEAGVEISIECKCFMTLNRVLDTLDLN